MRCNKIMLPFFALVLVSSLEAVSVCTALVQVKLGGPPAHCRFLLVTLLSCDCTLVLCSSVAQCQGEVVSQQYYVVC